MSDEITNVENDENETLAAEIEALKAEMVLREAAISEYEAQDSAREEESRVALVHKATEMGLKGHEDFSTDTLNSVISSWETSRPTFEAAVPATSAPTSAVEAAAPTSVVANYLNGELVETDENLYSRAYNAWASAWNRTLSGIEVSDGMRAKPYDEVKDQL